MVEKRDDILRRIEELAERLETASSEESARIARELRETVEKLPPEDE